MIKASDTDKRLKNSILDLLEYLAKYKTSLSDSEILHLLPVRASSAGVSSHLRNLVDVGKVKKLKDGSFGIAKQKYPSHHRLPAKPSSIQLSKKTKRIIRWARLVPFIQSVAIVSTDTLSVQSHAQNNPRLIFITLPGRIYLSKDIIRRLFYHNKDTKTDPATQQTEYANSCRDIFYSTAGVRFSEKMGSSDQERVLWFALAKPIYGQTTWQTVLQNDRYIFSHLPNYPWGERQNKINVGMSRWLDKIDNTLYRSYLKETALLGKYQDADSFLRIRPDVFIAKEN